MTFEQTGQDGAPAHAGSGLSFPVVGVGGSAGGLQALLRFFEHMPADPGMAFVVVLHLSRDHDSSAAQILQRATSMPVAQVSESVAIQVNHIYVIAPRADLLMTDGHLELARNARSPSPAVAIDVFFRTLAKAHRNRAFCIVLSGTGSDGAVGLTCVKEEGGLTIAQEPGDAEHGDMPRAAIATGMVDFILPAEAMGRKLCMLWGNARKIQRPDRDAAEPSESLAELRTASSSDQTLVEIMALLRASTRHDFRRYKRGTVLRRVERRLQVNGLHDLASYRDFLQSHPEEAEPLLQDMLISVTRFFRDAAAFEALETDVFPNLLRDRPAGDLTRVWVAGCATGEESYSLSILLRELAQSRGDSGNAQIFATDIDERAIAVARRGVYPNGIAADVSPARLERFFSRAPNEYRVTAEIREQVLFASHNLLRDPPFSRLDLICCRNLLIYLDQSAQASALEMFRYALKPGGYLFLGTSESADGAGDLFTSIDKKNRIYRASAIAPTRVHATYLSSRDDVAPPAPPPSAQREPARAQEHKAAAYEHLDALHRVSPASVLIDGQYEVLHLSPTAGNYMARGGGVPSNNLLNNVAPELRLELRSAIFKTSHSGSKTHVRVPWRKEGKEIALDLVVHPLPAPLGADRLLVFFEEHEPALPEDAGRPATETTQFLMLGELELDNKQLRSLLQETLERSALSNEELKASNEELQAINEELRSATEELETSKEELQSMNEELSKVNVELRTKVEERGQINDDLQNLISSSEVATVFVDSGMCVKRFTPQASKLFNLIASDIGRSLFDITNRLNYGELAEDAAAVFRDLRIIERQITTTDERRFFARILPYRTTSDRIDGAVLTFFDVTELRQAEDKVLLSEERLRAAAAGTSDFAIITTDDAGNIATWNMGAELAFGHASEDMIGHSIAEIFTPQDRENGVPEAEIRLAREVGRAEDEGWRQRKDGTTFYCSGVLTRLPSTVGAGFCKIARDLTGSKRQELARENLLLREQQATALAKREVEMKDKFLAIMSHELKQPLNLIQVNAELLTRLPETREIAAASRIGATIQRAVVSQTKIINDLLDLSRVRTGKMRLNFVELSLDELVRTLVQAASGDLARKGLTIEVRSCERFDSRCDRTRIEQVIWNLVSNAIKFTAEGGTILVELQADREFVKIVVSDSGCGIDQRNLPHVFEMFNQLDAKLSPSNGGLGIGLALVRELAQAHGGSVDVASAGLEQGSTFTVRLPVVPVERVGSDEAQAVPAVDFHGWSILIVDDDFEAMDSFASLLRLEGAIVNAASTPYIALELLETRDYGLILSDIGMPGMDGHQFIAEVRQRMLGKSGYSIALSGFGRPVDAERALLAGFDAHLAKPASVLQLRESVGRLMATRELLAAIAAKEADDR